MISEIEIRMKAAELSAGFVSHVALAYLTQHKGDNFIVYPLELAPLFEEYIRTGKILSDRVPLYRLVQ